MADLNFIAPLLNEKLLDKTDKHYYVRNLIKVKEVRSKLKDAERSLKNEGPEFIIKTFDTFYSIIQQSEILQIDLIIAAQQMLLQPVQDLKRIIVVALKNTKSLDKKSKLKHQNVIKMLIYVYVNINVAIEQKIQQRKLHNLNVEFGKRTRRPNADELALINQKVVVTSIHAIFQEKIYIFWDPPIVDKAFVSMTMKICYQYIDVPWSRKELQSEVYHFVSTLIKDYQQGPDFSHEVVIIVKKCDIPPWPLLECVRILVENYNCKNFMADVVKGLIILQLEKGSQEGKRSLIFLIEMSKMMPAAMSREIIAITLELKPEAYLGITSCVNLLTRNILNALTKDNLTEEKRKSREIFLYFLEERINDVSEHVRSNVLQHLTQLLTKNAIHENRKNSILRKVIALIRNEFSMVQISAAKCVTAFLSYNTYGAGLELHSKEVELEQKVESLNSMKSQFDRTVGSKVAEMRAEWKKHEEQLRIVIEKKLQESTFLRCDVDEDALPDIIETCISDGKYEEAFLILLYRSASKQIDEWNEGSESGQLKLLMLLQNMFMDANINSSNESHQVNLEECETVNSAISSLKNVIEFLQLMNDAVEPMKSLIESPNVDAMQAAISFFVSAFQSNINNAPNGFSEMLKLMNSNDPQRTGAVIEAFKIMYLKTELSSINKHHAAVARKLINLTKSINHDVQGVEFRLLISQSVANGVIHDDTIDILWDIFDNAGDPLEVEPLIALYLLKAAALGRQTINTTNTKLVTAIGFGERGQQSLLLMKGVIQFLLDGKLEKIKREDETLTHLINIASNKFYVNDSDYNEAITEIVKYIYKVCTEPDALCKDLINKIWETLPNTDNVPFFIIEQCSHILGEVVIRHLAYMTEVKTLHVINNPSNSTVEKVSSTIDEFGEKSRIDVSATDDILIEHPAEVVGVELISYIAEKCTIFLDYSTTPYSFSPVLNPWINKLFVLFLSEVFEVRRATFYLLAHLILKDILKPHIYLLPMAIFLIAEQEQLRSMSKEFFTKLFHKNENLCTMLPHIFSGLSHSVRYEENNVYIIIKFLLSLIDEINQNQSLVVGLCKKFNFKADIRHCKYLAYGLSLIKYDTNGLTMLLDNLELHPTLLHQPETSAIFKQLLTEFIESSNQTGLNNEMDPVTGKIKARINKVLSSGCNAAAVDKTVEPRVTGAIKKKKEFLVKKKQKKENFQKK